MKNKMSRVAAHWANHLQSRWTGGFWCIDRDAEIYRKLGEIDDLIMKVAASKGVLFSIYFDKNGRPRVKFKPLAKQLLACANGFDESLVSRYLSRHAVTPCFEIWQERKVWNIEIPVATEDAVTAVNRRIDQIREDARTASFARSVAHRKRSARKKRDSTIAFISGQCRRARRLFVVRVDLSYKPDPSSLDFSPFLVPDLMARSNFRDILSFVRKKLPYLSGYLWNVQYGAARGHLFHLMLIFDGTQLSSDEGIGKKVADRWNVITSGQGACWDCNAEPELYARRGLPRVGMVDTSKGDQRRPLIELAVYFATNDFFARYISRSFARTFGKSVIKAKNGKRRKSKRKDKGAMACGFQRA